MSDRRKLPVLLPVVVVGAMVMSSSWITTSAQQQAQAQTPEGRGGRTAGPGPAGAPPQAVSTARPTGSPGVTNGVPGTPLRQNPFVDRPLQNEGLSSNPWRYLQMLVGSYGPINLSNHYPNPYKRIEPWGEFPASYGGRIPSTTGAEGMPDGNLAVMTRCLNNGCEGQKLDPILILDRKSGKLIRSFGGGMYDGPHGFAVDHEGNLWTPDQDKAVVYKWSKEGKLLMTIGTEGKPSPRGEPNMLFQPVDVAVDAEGFVYIANSHAKMGPAAFIAKYAPDGKFVKILAKGPVGGSGAGYLDEPHSITIDIRGRLFIGDRSNNRIQIWDREGNFIQEWRQFSRPSGIHITADDRILVFDSESWGPDNPGWQKGWREGNALTGVISHYAMDIESRDYSHSGPEFGGMDADGNVYACVVRREQLERHEPAKPSTNVRTAAWGPYVQNPAAFPAQPVAYPAQMPNGFPNVVNQGRGGGRGGEQ
jgi:hypothetical protein